MQVCKGHAHHLPRHVDGLTDLGRIYTMSVIQLNRNGSPMVGAVPRGSPRFPRLFVLANAIKSHSE